MRNFKKPKPQATKVICLWPGCDKELKDFELAFSKYCFKHEREKKQKKTVS
jgi:hypothetical protein